MLSIKFCSHVKVKVQLEFLIIFTTNTGLITSTEQCMAYKTTVKVYMLGTVIYLQSHLYMLFTQSRETVWNWLSLLPPDGCVRYCFLLLSSGFVVLSGPLLVRPRLKFTLQRFGASLSAGALAVLTAGAAAAAGVRRAGEGDGGVLGEALPVFLPNDPSRPPFF